MTGLSIYAWNMVCFRRRALDMDGWGSGCLGVYVRLSGVTEGDLRTWVGHVGSLIYVLDMTETTTKAVMDIADMACILAS